MSTAPKILAFVGPCLPSGLDPTTGSERTDDPDLERWRRALEGVELRPPAARGDILAALCEHPDVIVLLDGYYYTVPAVTHKELLYALDRSALGGPRGGTRVIGASSMGALRAVELEPFGMEGVGQVFRWYRDGHLEADDEVALLHADASQGWRPLTVALVEVRHALAHPEVTARLEDRGPRGDQTRGDRRPAAELVAELGRLPFTERRPGVVGRAARRHLGEEAAAALERALAADSIKRRDALEALERAREVARQTGQQPAGQQVPGRPREEGSRADTHRSTSFLSFFQEAHGAPPPAAGEAAGAQGAPSPTHLETWRAAQLLHPEAARLVAQLRRRFLLASAALHRNLEPPAARVAELEAQLAEHEERVGPLLPRPERRDEARTQALAETALEAWGGDAAALGALAEHLGVEPALAPERFTEVLEARFDLFPDWFLIRAFAYGPSRLAAAAVARDAAQVAGLYRRSGGPPPCREALEELAAELWGCTEGQDLGAEERRHLVHREAARRGLFPSRGFSHDLYHGLAGLAPAERLPRPVNGYPEARAALLETPLALAFELP